VNLIANTTTRGGLIIKATLDTNQYDIQIKITDEPLRQLKLVHHTLNSEWNYTIKLRRNFKT